MCAGDANLGPCAFDASALPAELLPQSDGDVTFLTPLIKFTFFLPRTCFKLQLQSTVKNARPSFAHVQKQHTSSACSP